jgi:hypothetical protein
MKLLGRVTSQDRRALAFAIAVGAIAFTGAAHSDPINFLPSNTQFSIKVVDREIRITTIGQELFGIFDITQINNAAGTTTFWNGNGFSDGTQLVGFFQGLISAPDQTGGSGLSFTGGSLSVFDVPNGTYSPGTSPNTKDYVNQLCGGSATCLANPWLTANFDPGINDSLFTTPRDATLQGALATTNVQAEFAYLSETGGANGAFFNTNGFTFAHFAPADLFLRSNFVLANAQTCIANNGWQVCSDDPIIGKTAGAPEPGSLALLVLGALAAWGIRRRSLRGCVVSR